MKQIMLLGKSLAVGAVLFLSPLNSQAQVFEEGVSIASLGYGFPNVSATWMKLYAIGETDTKTSSLGPLHAKFEYGITDKLGIGASINFATAKLVDPYSYEEFNSTTGLFETVNHEDEIKFSSINFLVRLNWHWVDHDKVDFYSGFGVGFNSNKFKFSSTDADLDVKEEETILNDLYNIIPIGYEATIGLRYLFTDNLGAYAEVGWAKSFVQIGVSYKF